MKYFAKLTVTLVASLLIGAIIDGAHAAPKKTGAKKATRTVYYGGDALKPKTNLKFDGRSVHALRAGKYDSLSLGDEGAKGAKRLYSLPADFSSRTADSEMEMRYRQ